MKMSRKTCFLKKVSVLYQSGDSLDLAHSVRRFYSFEVYGIISATSGFSFYIVAVAKKSLVTEISTQFLQLVSAEIQVFIFRYLK